MKRKVFNLRLFAAIAASLLTLSIPATHLKASNSPLCFTARNDSVTVSFHILYYMHTIQYSTDSVTWNTYTSDSAIPLAANAKVYFRAATNQTTLYSFANFSQGDRASNLVDVTHYSYFYFSSNNGGTVEGSGNIMSLYGPDCPNSALPLYAFAKMFYQCTLLTKAPSLPATTLAEACYAQMFFGCTSLTTAPVLPAMKAAKSCYLSMFYGCTSLTTAPALPADTMADYCYQQMFDGCTSLTAAPQLPATSLAYHCYWLMFNRCTSLMIAPTLPATTMRTSCYAQMFQGCTSLTTAPALPATVLNNHCYKSMFEGCTSLEKAPTLPATTMKKYCYKKMFSGCTSLKIVPELPATTVDEGCYDSMFYNCTSIVVDSTPAGAVWRIPPGVQYKLYYYRSMFAGTSGNFTGEPKPGRTYFVASDPKPMPLNFIAKLGDVAVSFNIKNATHAIEYSTNGFDWAPYTSRDTIQLIKSYSIVYFRAVSDQTTATAFGSKKQSNSSYFNFTTAAGYKSNIYFVMSSGNIMSLYGPNFPDLPLQPYAFAYMFYNKDILSAPELPATTLASNCYRSMFEGCTLLTKTPELPATILADSCYLNMFLDCKNLTSVSDLPATTLTDYCYASMFENCSTITVAPELPATTLANHCYEKMFYNCKALTSAPNLPATTLKYYCYSEMFYNCEKLTSIPELPAKALRTNCYYRMFYGCSALKVNISAPGMSWKIPTNTSIASNWNTDMFAYTGGTFTGSPVIGTTYYIETALPKPLCFTARNGSVTVRFDIKNVSHSMQYSTDNANWSTYTSNASINLSANNKVYFRSADNLSIATAFGVNEQSNSSRFYFTSSDGGTIDASGDIMSLYGSSSLPLLPYAFANMFYDCTILTSLPEMYATSLAEHCYQKMFYGCSSLKIDTSSPGATWSIPSNATVATDWNANMFAGTGGTFTSNPVIGTTYYIKSALPQPLCFTARNGAITVRFKINNINHAIQYSTDSTNWSTYTSNSPINLNANGKVYFRTETNQETATPFGSGYYNNSSRFYFTSSNNGTVEASGDMMSLYGSSDLPLQENAFEYMFEDCARLTKAPALSATTLANYCYRRMFCNCSSLTSAPELPATTLADNCYFSMFSGCTSLTSAPELPATTLADDCYYHMFAGCTSLTSAPELPATTLAYGCYTKMFYNCTSLKVNLAAPGKQWRINTSRTYSGALSYMFTGTAGTMNGTPSINTTYYIASGPQEVIISDSATICQGGSYVWRSKTLTSAGIYYDTVAATTGVDTIYQLTLTVLLTDCTAPTGLTVANTGIQQLTITWANGSTTQPNNFTILVKKTKTAVNPDDYNPTATGLTTCSYTHNGSYGSDYRIYVKNVYDTISSDWVEITAKTLSRYPAVENLNVTNISYDGFRVNWTTNQYSGISHWEVKVNDGSSDVFTKTVTTKYCNVTGLSAETQYSVTVTPKSSSGVSGDPNSTTATTAEAPEATDAPTGLTVANTGIQQLTITWANGSATQPNNFTIFVKKTKTAVNPDNYTPTATGLTTCSYTHNGSYGSDYRIYVKNVYNGVSSEWVETTARTLSRYPAVENLGVDNITYDAFRVNWTTNQYSGISRWEVKVNDGSSDVFTKTVTTKYCNVTGLSPETQYTVTVTPKSSSGVSGDPNSTTATTAEAPEATDAPAGLTVANTGIQQLTITWANGSATQPNNFTILVKKTKTAVNPDNYTPTATGLTTCSYTHNGSYSSDYRIYVKNVYNGVSSEWVETTARTLSRYPAVENLNVTNITHSGFRINWTTNQYSGISHWEVKINVGSSDVFTTTVTTKYCNVTGLNPETQYTVTVTPKTSGGKLGDPASTTATTSAVGVTPVNSNDDNNGNTVDTNSDSYETIAEKNLTNETFTPAVAYVNFDRLFVERITAGSYVTIVDAAGRTIYNAKVNDSRFEYGLYVRGMYTIIIRDEKRRQVLKAVY